MKRYCGMCDEWVRGAECPKCGAGTDRPVRLPRTLREACPRCDGDGFAHDGGNCPRCGGGGTEAVAALASQGKE